MARWCTKHNNDNDKTSVRSALTNNTPYMALVGGAMGCLSSVIRRKITAIYRKRTVTGFCLDPNPALPIFWKLWGSKCQPVIHGEFCIFLYMHLSLKGTQTNVIKKNYKKMGVVSHLYKFEWKLWQIQCNRDHYNWNLNWHPLIV